MKSRFAFPLGILLALVAFGSLATIYNPPSPGALPSPFTVGVTSVTTTGTELNYVTGVTSAIQTQIDGKQPSDGDLTSLAAASGENDIYYRSAANTWNPVTIGGNLRLSSGTLDTNGHLVTSSATATFVPVSNGTDFLASSIIDDGTSLVSGGYGISKFVFDSPAGTATIGDPDGNGAGAKLAINNNDGSINLSGVSFLWNGTPFDFAASYIVAGGVGSSIAGSFSGVGTATTSFVVTIGVTMTNSTYKVNATPTAALSAAVFYISAKTTTTFTVTYLAGLTGTVTFDWTVSP